MAKNKFDWPTFEEFIVLDENKARLGTIRIKPNAILWAPWNAKANKKWFGVTLEEFSAFAEKLNKKQAH
ncbi:MAG TPA: hypothetical protein VII63_02615 [Caulobacteraceae bacterium]